MEFAGAVDQAAYAEAPRRVEEAGRIISQAGISGGRRLADQEAGHRRHGRNRKRDDLPPQDRLPETIGGYAVDVRQADGRCRASRLLSPRCTRASRRPSRRNSSVRPFPMSAIFQASCSAPLTTEATRLRLGQARQQQITLCAACVARRSRAITDNMTITCHASPRRAAGQRWKEFLEGTKSSAHSRYVRLHVHPHRRDSDGRPGKSGRSPETVVLDHPPGKSNREQTDDQTVDDLTSALGGHFSFAWALERADPKVATWIYPSAYHIKVAVRDSEAFWLSSGNWNSTNQPDIDPLTRTRRPLPGRQAERPRLARDRRAQRPGRAL